MVRLAMCLLVATVVVSGCSDEQGANNTDDNPATSNAANTADQNNDDSNQNNDSGPSWTLVITDLDEATGISVPDDGFEGDSAMTGPAIQTTDGKRIQFAAPGESSGFIEITDREVLETGGTTTAIFNFAREEPYLQCSNPFNENDPGESTFTVTSVEPLHATFEADVLCADDPMETGESALPAKVSGNFENILNVL